MASTPMYKQVRDYIMDNIRSKKWSPDERIPSENELTKQFNVSRVTVRSALSELTADGWIYRIRGKGSFVSGSGKIVPDLQLTSVHDNKQKLIAYLMPRLDNLFTANLLSGIQNVVSERGHHLLFYLTNDSAEEETRILQNVVELGVQGIIIYPVANENYSEQILKLTLNQFPLVVVDRHLQGVQTNCVCADHEQGAYMATEHLIALGHSRIGCFSTDEVTSSVKDRIAGYVKAMEDHQLTPQRKLQSLHYDAAELEELLLNNEAGNPYKEALKKYIRENSELTAIFAINSGLGLATMEAVQECGMKIPDDFSVIFFDDYEASSFAQVPATYIDQQEYVLGREATNLLFSILENPQMERRKIVTPTRLIVRKSTTSLGRA
jgi:GntR family transcriptional regulator of arabinose operon